MALQVKNEAEARRFLQMTIAGEAEDVTPTAKKPRASKAANKPEPEKKKRDNPELREQIRYFDKIHVLRDKYPDLRRAYSHLTGVFIVPHKLDEVSESGMIRGLLDIEVRVPRIHEGVVYAGLALDLKTPTGTPTPEQLDWATYLRSIGYRTYFCKGVKGVFSPWQEAWVCTAFYLGMEGEATLPTFSEAEEYALYQWREGKKLARAQKARETRARKAAQTT